MDPSPFIEKDLDDDAEEFIVSWAQEFSPNARKQAHSLTPDPPTGASTPAAPTAANTPRGGGRLPPTIPGLLHTVPVYFYSAPLAWLYSALDKQLQTTLDRSISVASRYSDSATMLQALGGGWWNQTQPGATESHLPRRSP